MSNFDADPLASMSAEADDNVIAAPNSATGVSMADVKAYVDKENEAILAQFSALQLMIMQNLPSGSSRPGSGSMMEKNPAGMAASARGFDIASLIQHDRQ